MRTSLRPRFSRSPLAYIWVFLALLGAVGSYAAGQQVLRHGRSAPRGAGARRAVRPSLRRAPQKGGVGINSPGPDFTWVQSENNDTSFGDDLAFAVTFGQNGTVVTAGELGNGDGANFAVAKYASNGELLWSRTLDDGSGNADAVVVDSQDNVIASGQERGFFVVAKWNSQGELLWVSPNPDTDLAQRGEAFSVAVDSHDNIFAGGILQVRFPQSDSQVQQFAVMQLDPDGGVTNFQTVGDVDHEGICNSVKVDHNDDVVCGGGIRIVNPEDFFVTKFQNTSLTSLWESSVPGSNPDASDAVRGVAIDQQNNVFAAGVVHTKTTGSGDFTVAKINGATGNQIWLKELDGGDGTDDFATGVAVDSNGNALASGDLQDGNGIDRFTVLKLDGTDGSTVWPFFRQGDGTPSFEGDNVANAVTVDASDNVVAGGFLQNTTGHDFTVVKLQANGTPVWVKSLNGGNNDQDEALAVAVDPNLNVAAAGFTINPNAGTDFTTAYSDEQPPVVSDGIVTPTTFTSAGGTSELDVTATDNVDLAGVFARIQFPNESFVDVRLSPVNTFRKARAGKGGVSINSQNGPYSGVFTFPPNQTASPQVYPVSFFATDTGGLTSPMLSAGAVTVNADASPPVIVGCSVNPPNVGPAGAPVTISATVTDNQPGATVVADVTLPDNTVTTITLVQQGGSGGGGNGPPPTNTNGTFTAVFSVPANFTGQPRTFPVTIRATDVANNQATAPCGPITQSADTLPPVLSNPQAVPSQLPQAGGSVALSVNVTDDQGVKQVTAVVTAPDNTSTTVTLLATDPEDPSVYTGTFSAPAAPAGSPAVFTTKFNATDTSNNSASLNGPNFTVGTDTTPPVISNVQVSPRNLSPDGGPVTISADVSDNVGVGPVTATITPPTGAPTTITLQRVPALKRPKVSGPFTYSGTYNVPANTTTGAQTYGVTVTATDTSGNVATASGGNFTVATPIVPPPAVANLTVTPRDQPFTGGTVTITANITDQVAITSVVAIVTRPNGQPPLTVPLILQGTGDTYSGSFATDQNLTQAAQVYSIVVSATNAQNSTTSIFGGIVTVAAPAPIQLLNAKATPNTIGAGGGSFQVTVDVVAPAGVDHVTATAVPNVNLPSITVDLTPAGPGTGGVVPYAGTFSLPVNPTLTPVTYTVTISGSDLADNTATADGGTVTQAASGGRISVSPGSINFGNVRVGWGLRKKVTIRNTGTGTLTGLVQRLTGVFTIVDITQTQKPGKKPHGGPVGTAFALNPGEELEVTIQFAPVNHKPQAGTLVVTSSDQRRSTVNVKLKGVGCGTPAHPTTGP